MPDPNSRLTAIAAAQDRLNRLITTAHRFIYPNSLANAAVLPREQQGWATMRPLDCATAATQLCPSRSGSDPRQRQLEHCAIPS